MSQTPDSRDASLPFAIQQQIDVICDRFEAAWRAGDNPRLEEYLDELSGSARTGLLSGLLAVEIEYRRDAEGNRVPDDLILAAHPELSEEVAEALQKLNQPQTTESHVAGPSPAGARGDDLPPDSIPGYTILKELNRGGQGVVYQAIQKSTHRKVALKVMLEGPFAGPDSRHRFEREVALVGSLRHPNIVPVFDSGVAQGRFYYAMEYVRGKSLKQYVQSAQLSLEQTLRLFKKVCDAVNCAHQRGVIHRDLKPTNILVDDTGEPHVLDFGLAKVGGAEVDGDSRSMLISVTGQVIGTLQYMCPEQAAGRPDQVDMRSDVYALGVILYELLTGTFPYDVKAQMADVLANILKAEPRRPSTISRQINDEVETIILKTLSKEKERRYDTAGALGRDIEHFLAGEPIDAKRDSVLYVLRKTLRRYKVPAGVAVGFVVLVTTAAIAMSIMYAQREAALTNAQANENAAQQAESEATRSRIAADNARRLAEDSLAKTQRLLYMSDMNRAAQAWESNDIHTVQVLLDHHTPKSYGEDFRGFEWYFLWQQLRAIKETRKIDLPESGPSVTFSRDGSTLAVGLVHGGVTIWSLGAQHRLLDRFGDYDPRRWKQVLDLSPDGKTVAYAAKQVLILRNLLTREKKLFEGHNEQVLAAAFSPDGKLVASASADTTVKVWRVDDSGEPIALRGHAGRVETVAFSPDGSFLVSSGGDRRVLIWTRGEERRVGLLHDSHVRRVESVAVSPDGRLVASGSRDHSVKIWNRETETVDTLLGHTDEVRSVAFSPNGGLLASGSRDYTARLWDVATRTEKATLKGHGGSVRDVAFSPDGKSLVTAGTDDAVRLWRIDKNYGSNSVRLNGWISHMAFSSDGEMLALNSDSVLHVVESGTTVTATSTDTEARILHENLCKPIESLASSSNGTFAIGRENGVVELWDFNTLKEQETIPLGWDATVSAVAFTADGQTLAIGSETGSIAVWDILNNRKLRRIPGHDDKVEFMAFNRDGTILATVSYDKKVKLWNVNSGTLLDALEGHTKQIQCLAFSPDGMELASGCRDHTVRLWEVTASPIRCRILRVPHTARGLAFSPDGGTLFSAGGDGVVRIWDCLTRQQRFSLDAHTVVFASLALSPDGRRLAAGTREGTVYFWRAASQKEVETADVSSSD